MDFYVIPPRAHAELMDLGDRYFCLAQQYQKDETYRQFFKERVQQGKWVTLDNGVGDHDFISQDELFDIMIDLQPSEVIPLDVLKNGKQTFVNAVEFILRMKKEGLQNIEVLAVPQGNTLDEWLECYVQLSNLSEVSTLGMSKLAIPWVISQSTHDRNIGRDRNQMMDILKEEKLFRKQLHFLGAGEPTEFVHYINNPFVRSTDSCFTIWSGSNNVRFDDNYQRIPTPKNYFDLILNENQLSLAKENIEIFRKILRHGKF